MVKVNVYGIDGSKKETISLPSSFETPIRPDIIQKSFNAISSNKRQLYGPHYRAGAQHATASVGKGQGRSRVPRLTQGRQAALAPCVVGGRRAHPPNLGRNWYEKMNKKERKMARLSALSATTKKDLVTKRGHQFDEKITLPLIVDDAFDNLTKTKEVIKALKNLGVYDDVLRAKNGKHIRAGKGKSRGRKYRTPKSILIISSNPSLIKGSKNLTGIDVAHPRETNIEHLAPGGTSGRLTIITKSALTILGGDA
ncbi:MAG: 50S ribosomal protein L4 [Candidatus Thermoplasmatota archaeon]|nr:50S ribosomal protein L4 [Candidatus Thermoplasmatota archaeon]